MTLNETQVGDTLCIIDIANPQIATMAMRLGICKGSNLSVCSKVPGGPVVVRRGHMEIALGRDICKQITVTKVSSQ